MNAITHVYLFDLNLVACGKSPFLPFRHFISVVIDTRSINLIIQAKNVNVVSRTVLVNIFTSLLLKVHGFFAAVVNTNILIIIREMHHFFVRKLVVVVLDLIGSYNTAPLTCIVVLGSVIVVMHGPIIPNRQ